jgi:hypothetical protein
MKVQVNQFVKDCFIFFVQSPIIREYRLYICGLFLVVLQRKFNMLPVALQDRFILGSFWVSKIYKIYFYLIFLYMSQNGLFRMFLERKKSPRIDNVFSGR